MYSQDFWGGIVRFETRLVRTHLRGFKIWPCQQIPTHILVHCLNTVWAKLIKGWCWAIFRQIEAQSSLHESSSLYQKNYWQISLQLPAGRIKTNQTKFASRHSQILLQNLSQFISIVIIYWEKLYILMYRIIKVLDIMFLVNIFNIPSSRHS